MLFERKINHPLFIKRMSNTQVVTQESVCADCNNTQDPITLDDIKDIPSKFLFKVTENNVTNCFDIRHLYEYYDKSKKLENPLTRTPFDDKTLDRFLKQVVELKIAKDNPAVQTAANRSDNTDVNELRALLTDISDDDDDSHRHRRRRHRSYHRPIRQQETVSSFLVLLFSFRFFLNKFVSRIRML